MVFFRVFWAKTLIFVIFDVQDGTHSHFGGKWVILKAELNLDQGWERGFLKISQCYGIFFHVFGSKFSSMFRSARPENPGAFERRRQSLSKTATNSEIAAVARPQWTRLWSKIFHVYSTVAHSTFALSGPVGTATAWALRAQSRRFFFFSIHPLVSGIQNQQ